MLAALDPNISLELAKRLVERRDVQPFASLSELTGDPLMKGIALKLQGLSVKTDYFMFRAEARIGSGRVRSCPGIARARKSKIAATSRATNNRCASAPSCPKPIA